jgi:hypothetical protein
MNTQLVESIVQVIHTLSPEEQALVRQKLSKVSPSALDSSPSSLEQRRTFLQKSPTERSQILSQQADTMLEHYQHSTEWRELMAGDIMDD